MSRGCCCSLCWCSNGAVSFHQVNKYIMKMRKRKRFMKLSVSMVPTASLPVTAVCQKMDKMIRAATLLLLCRLFEKILRK